MAPSLAKSAPQPFEQTWHETDTTAFDPASLPVFRAPRAWDRKVQTIRSRDGREKKVYRRYGLRSQPVNVASGKDEEEDPQDPRSRATKKLRMRSDETHQPLLSAKSKTHASKGTRFDRRKSVLPRKRTTTRQRTPDGGLEDQDVEEHNPSLDDHASQSIKDLASAGDIEEAAPRRRSSRRKTSTFTFTMQKPRDAPRRRSTGHMIRDSGEPILGELSEDDHRDGAYLATLHTAPAPAAVESGLSKVMAHIPSPRAKNDNPLASPLPQVTLTSITTDNNYEGSSGDNVEVEKDATEETSVLLMGGELDRMNSVGEALVTPTIRTAAEELLEVESVPVEQTSIQEIIAQRTPSKDALIDQQDAEMSDFALDIFGSSPSQEASLDADVETDSESPIDDVTITEESLQLEIQQEMELASIEERDYPAKSPVDAQAILQDEEEEEKWRSEDEVEQKQMQNPYHSTVSGDGTEIVEPLDQSVQSEGEDDSVVLNSYELFQPEDSKQEHVKDGAEEPLLSTSEFLESPAFDIDIAAGLTLNPAPTIQPTPPGHQLRSPPPPMPESPPEDITMTMPLDDDTALLKDFLTRAAQSKANKAAVVHRRESLQNRRDSGAVRYALASPRKVLEDKDPNSPSKYDNDVTLDLSQTLTLSMAQHDSLSPPTEQVGVDDEDTKSLKSSRRSTRPRKSRLPAYSSGQQAQGPTSISVRRVDGGEPIVLKKTEAQELGLLTRNNTRKNKQGALIVTMRLLKMKAEAKGITFEDASPDPDPAPKMGKKNVQWDTTLAYFQEDTGGLTRTGRDAERRSLETPDELSMSIETSSSKSKSKGPKDKATSSTPKTRRVKGLGASNGTPGRGLLAPASLLPDDIVEEREIMEKKTNKLPKPSSKVKKVTMTSTTTALEPPAVSVPKETKLPNIDVAPSSIDPKKASQPVKERKSKLATPKKLKLPQTVSLAPAVPSEGKENQQLLLSPPKKKKGLQLPQVIVPPVMDSGLPRRRPVRRL